MEQKQNELIQKKYQEKIYVAECLRNYGLQPAEEILIDKYLTPGAKVLDLGCGGGRVTTNLFERDVDVVGLDYNPVVIAAAKKRFPHLPLLVGDARDLPFEKGSFDAVIFAFNGIDHIAGEEERAKALREIHRVLKPGGTFIFSSHNLKSFLFSALASSPRRFYLKNICSYFEEEKSIQDKVYGEFYTHFSSIGFYKKILSKNSFDFLEHIGNRQIRLGEIKQLSLLFRKENLVDHWVYYACKKRII